MQEAENNKQVKFQPLDTLNYLLSEMQYSEKQSLSLSLKNFYECSITTTKNSKSIEVCYGWSENDQVTYRV